MPPTQAPGLSMVPAPEGPSSGAIVDDYAWPSGANYELGPKVQSFDVPLGFEQMLPRNQVDQTMTPLIKPAGGNIARDENITLFLNHSCASEASIWYTCNGQVPVPFRAERYRGPFSLSTCCQSDWFQPEHVVVGAVAMCPGLRPSPVNSRWFYVMSRTPPPLIHPVGFIHSCDPVLMTVTHELIKRSKPLELRAAISFGSFSGLGDELGSWSLTESGCECDLPFVYRGHNYTGCTEADWSGNPWCYVKGTTCGTAFYNRRFDRCKPFDPFAPSLWVHNSLARLPPPPPPPPFTAKMSLLASETLPVEAVSDMAPSSVLVQPLDGKLVYPVVGEVLKAAEYEPIMFYVPPGLTAFVSAQASFDGALPSSVTLGQLTVTTDHCWNPVIPPAPPAPPTPEIGTPTPTPTPTATGTPGPPTGTPTPTPGIPGTPTPTPTPGHPWTPTPTPLVLITPTPGPPTETPTPTPGIPGTPTPTPTPGHPTPTPTPTSAPTPTATPCGECDPCPPCTRPTASAPMPTSYPENGVIAASMMVSLHCSLGENGTIYYTTNGEVPTNESKRYTTPFYLTEDGQACQEAAELSSAARANPGDCAVILRAICAILPQPRQCDRSSCLCLADSPVYSQTFGVLSA